MLTPHANFNDLGFMRLNNFIDGQANVSVYNAFLGQPRTYGLTLRVQY